MVKTHPPAVPIGKNAPSRDSVEVVEKISPFEALGV